MQQLLLSQFTLVSGMGIGLARTYAALEAGESGLRPQSLDGELDTWIGKVAEADSAHLADSLQRFDCRNNRLAALALAQDGFTTAVISARERYGSERVGIFLGTSTSGIEEAERVYRHRDPVSKRLSSGFRYMETHNTFSLAQFVASKYALNGPAVVVSAACATTAKVFGTAARMIAAGFCDAAIVGGADSLCATTMYGFRSLGLLSSEPCRPFDAARNGISIGEAAGFAVVEKPGAALAENAVLVEGFGESSDAHHMSTPDPEGTGARLAIERALTSARLTPRDIDYVNLHGTATLVGDASEDRAMVTVFGDKTPCSSTKGLTGHTLGAAGIIEILICALALQRNLIPGGAHTKQIDPSLRSRYLLRSTYAPMRHVISNSFGFGGSNCTVVLGRQV